MEKAWKEVKADSAEGGEYLNIKIKMDDGLRRHRGVALSRKRVHSAATGCWLARSERSALDREFVEPFRPGTT